MHEEKRILLLHVPYGELYGRINIQKLGWGVPPLGLTALSAYIQKHAKAQVKIIDMLFSGLGIGDIPNILDDFKPEIVGLSATTPQMDNAYILSQAIKKYNPRTQVVIGGPHASALPQRTLGEEPSIDYAIVGEGEIPFLSLVKGRIPDSIKSLVWRKGQEIVVNEREALIEDLGSLPFPDYASLPLSSYGTFYTGHSVGIMGGRGCFYNCSFCASSIIHMGRYRMRPVDIFLDDIARLLKLGVPRFDIWDDTFTALHPRVYEFTEKYRQRNLKAHWTCETRVDCVDKKLLKQMHAAGLDMLHIGCESGNQDVLNKTGKGIKLEQVKQVCSWCEEIGIAAYVYFILGLPYDTKGTIEETILFAKRLNIDFAQFSMLVPLPGTHIWHLAGEGKVLRNLAKRWSDYDRYGSAIVESNAVSAQELTGLYKYALRSFYLRFSYIWKALKRIESIEKIKRYARLAILFFKFIRTN